MSQASNTDDTVVRLVEARTHGRYLLRVPPGSALGVLVGFHGYGEHAAIQLDRLRKIPGADRWVLVAVQALHRFYNTRTQEVVGSWMTSQDREQAIIDNLQYVGSVVSEVRRASTEAPGVLVYAGFSQGVAMACRAAAYAGHPCAGVILLGGDVPPEIRADTSVRFPAVLLGRGRDDTWYTQPTYEADIDFLQGRAASLEPLLLPAGHEWTDDFQVAAGRLLDKAVSLSLKP